MPKDGRVREVETWMPVYVQDLLVSTAGMSPAQFGGFVRLLLTAWANHESGGLKNDMEECCRIAGGLAPADWQRVRARFVVADSGTSEERLTHPRLEAEWERAKGARDTKRRNLEKARAAKESIQESIHKPIHRSIDKPIDRPMPEHVHNPSSPSPSPSPSEEDDSSTKNLRATPQKRRRTYRITWDLSGGFSGITDEDRDSWGRAYPGVNLTAELAKAHVYLRENPSKAGKRNWGAFLARWFGRVQDRGGSAAAQPQPPSEKRYWSGAANGYVRGLAAYDAAARARKSPQGGNPALDGIRPDLKTIGPEN